MVLLAVVVVGLLGLSSVVLRSSSQGVAMAEARANARLALAMAIGQLQKHAGDDRRITCPADQLSKDGSDWEPAAVSGRRFWTGVYDSWAEGVAGRPEPRLREWLVSGWDLTDEQLPTRSGDPGMSVRLVGPGSAGRDTGGWIEAPLVELASGGAISGRVAWWTGDEGVKAMVATPPADPPDSLAGVRARQQAVARFGVQMASSGDGKPFEDFDRRDPRLGALTGWPQTAFLAKDSKSARPLFHDLASRTSGLLVNVRGGGYRRDLSMEFEMPESSRNNNPLYTVGREKGISLQELRGYYHLYKALQPASGRYTTGGSIPRNTLAFVLGDSPVACERDENFHFKMPSIISLQVVYSLQARRLGSDSNALNRLYLALDPIITLWNPLNVPVVIPTTAWMTVNFFQFPYTIDVQANRRTWECPLIATLSGETVSRHTDTNFLGLRIGEIEQIVLKPGEVVKVSQSGDLRVEGNSPNRALQAKAGFNYGGGLARPMLDKFGQAIDLPADATVIYTMRPNGLTAGQTSRSGRSMSGANQHTRHHALHYHEFFIGTDRPNAGGLGYGGISIDADFGNERATPGVIWLSSTPGTKPPGDRIYADRREYAGVFPTFSGRATQDLPVAHLLSKKAPILMYTYSAKTETSSPTGTRTMLRSNPRAHKLDFYALDKYEFDLQPYDFEVEALSSWVNRKLETSVNGHAYYGGGYDAAAGNSFVIQYSVPHEPIHSLGALQHSMANGFLTQAPQQGYTNLNARQPMLPQVSHAIGNSFAPAVMSSYETSRVIKGNRPIADHSYLANLALWDQWFFSSVAPQTTAGQARRRSQREVADDFLKGTAPLPIANYRPDLGNREAATAVSRLFGRTGVTPVAIDLMASLIRVDGMFNVNSTSVEAWKALLSGLLGEDLVTHDEQGTQSRTREHRGVPVAGSLVPRDVVAEGKGALAVREPQQWIGRRVLSEAEITELATAIVREVRRRGPFLSLADFVNRRVGPDPVLARAGAIQSALDSEDVSINEGYRAAGRTVSQATAGRLPFPEAEKGPASEGIPGIVKQADILTPLAPLLSARSDTFLIRAYGESVDLSGKVRARAWCEARLERDAEFVDPAADSREIRPGALKSAINQSFGRRFQVTAFRWLASEEL